MKQKMQRPSEGENTSSEKSRSMTAKEKEAYVDRVTAPVRSVGKNVGRRLERIRAAGLSTLGGAALGASGAIERLRDKDESDRYFKRSRNSLRSAGRSAKAIFAGEPDDNIEDKYIDAAGEMIPGTEKINYRSGGSTGRGGGCEIRGKTKGRMI